MDGVTVDANVIRRFRDQLANDEGDLYHLITALAEHCGLVVDEGGIIEQEWTGDGVDHLVGRWMTDEFRENRLRSVVPHLDSTIKQTIRVQYGLPPSSRDIVYIGCANVTELRYVLAEDMDLYDPRNKKAKGKQRDRLMRHREGPLCRYLWKKLRIRVGMCCHCESDLGLELEDVR